MIAGAPAGHFAGEVADLAAILNRYVFTNIESTSYDFILSSFVFAGQSSVLKDGGDYYKTPGPQTVHNNNQRDAAVFLIPINILDSELADPSADIPLRRISSSEDMLFLFNKSMFVQPFIRDGIILRRRISYNEGKVHNAE